jgi:Zn-dependent protease with chaperone function
MSTHMIGVLRRAVLYSLLSGVVAAIIYMIINLATGGKLDGNSLLGSLITGLISFVIALLFFTGFMLYFSRNKA